MSKYKVRTEAIEALLNGTIYDFVINNAYRMDKDDIARIAAELSYAIYTLNGKDTSKAVEQMAAGSLANDYWNED